MVQRTIRVVFTDWYKHGNIYWLPSSQDYKSRNLCSYNWTIWRDFLLIQQPRNLFVLSIFVNSASEFKRNRRVMFRWEIPINKTINLDVLTFVMSRYIIYYSTVLTINEESASWPSNHYLLCEPNTFMKRCDWFRHTQDDLNMLNVSLCI